jgi:hypothetical protein
MTIAALLRTPLLLGFLAAGEPAPEVPCLAVLPFDSLAVDFEAERIVRYWVHNRLERRGYALVSIEETDAALKVEHAITQGGQLKSADAAAIAESLGAHGLVYGEVGAFDTVNVLLARWRTVQVTLRMVEARSGRVRWLGAGEASSPGGLRWEEIPWRSFAPGVYDDFLRKSSRTLYDPLAMAAVRAALEEFPGGPF